MVTYPKSDLSMIELIYEISEIIDTERYLFLPIFSIIN